MVLINGGKHHHIENTIYQVFKKKTQKFLFVALHFRNNFKMLKK